jgi:hypothetical protein
LREFAFLQIIQKKIVAYKAGIVCYDAKSFEGGTPGVFESDGGFVV